MSRHSSAFWQGKGEAYLLLLPFFIFFAIFWVVPLLGGFRASLYSNEVYGPTHFVGLDHYRELLSDSRFARAFTNTLLYTACSVTIIVPLSLFLAQILRRVYASLRPGLNFLLLLPGLTPPAVLALLFLLVFHGREGLLNQLFILPFGLKPINWIKDPHFILLALVLQTVWRWTGFITFFILSGMEAIPAAYYEATHLETNSAWQGFRHVTIPLLRHVLVFSAVYLVVDAFALFSGAYVLLGGSGGTSDAGLLLVSYTYQQAFAFGHFGTASAISMSAAPLLMLLLWLCFVRRRQVAF